MRARAVLLLSLLLNITLAGMIVFLSRESEELLSGPALFVSEDGIPRVRTHVVLRRQPITWAELESQDYPGYIRNLRAIGCPERTVRDIIVADVNALFAERMSRELVLPEQQWWKPEPEMEVMEAAREQIQALNREKEALLAQLLGPDWNEAPAAPVSAPVRLDGPVLSGLSDEVKAEVYQIARAAQSAEEAYIEEAAAAGLEPDPAKLAQLRNHIRTDLAKVLTPAQLEEYLLRYSDTAENLRDQLRGFGTTAEEFRRIFRARDAYDVRIAALDPDDPASAERRAELERQRERAVRQVISKDRFAAYQLTDNVLFRDAQAVARRSGAAPEKVLPIFQVNQAASEEVARLRLDPRLSAQERITAIRIIEDQQRSSIEKILRGEPMMAPLPEGMGE